MPPLLADRITESMAAVRDSYHRLVLVVGPSGSGKTTALQQVRDSAKAPLVNVNLELSKRLLDLTERQRSLQIPKLLDQIVSETAHDEVLLDNNEILFDVSLKQDPLRLFQGLSRSRTVVVSWNGRTNTENLSYATPDHPEFHQYPLADMTIVAVEGTGQIRLPEETNK
ncbi:MAG TPA: BREX-3 system P-loop-containing protein BrxF [Verrucomicrobiae bacterium]|nr:BREX-3 system P-loop-containing protein BrxF [Verrucomicrobiae bacterium]